MTPPLNLRGILVAVCVTQLLLLSFSSQAKDSSAQDESSLHAPGASNDGGTLNTDGYSEAGSSVLADDSFKALIDKIDQAYFQDDKDALDKIASEQSDTTTANPEQAAYAKAFVCYRLGLMSLSQQDKLNADDYFQSGLDHISSYDQHHSDAEYLALKSSMLGMKIAIKPMRGISLGSRSDKAIDLALSLAPNSPRVQFIKAKSLYNKPSWFGGDKRQAIQILNESLKLLNNEQPYWGRTDILYWQAINALSDKDSAKANQIIKKLDELHSDSPKIAELKTMAENISLIR